MAADSLPPSFERYAAEPVPQAAVGVSGKDGVLELTFERASRGTALSRNYAIVPSHVSGTPGHDPHPEAETVPTRLPTGGVAQGDCHDLTIAVEADAIVHISTQSSTKVQTMEHNYVGVDIALSAATGGHLDYIPEPTIPRADARYAQDLHLDVADGTTAIVSDVVVSERLAHSERFEFDRCCSRLRATGPDGPPSEDVACLAPGESDPNTPGLLSRRAVYGTLFAVMSGRDVVSLSDGLREAVAATDARAGATKLPNDAGVAVCALGDCADTVRTACDVVQDRARRALLDASALPGGKY